MEGRFLKTLIKVFRIALAAALLGAGISFILARLDRAPFFFSLAAFFMVLSFFFGFSLLVLLILCD